MADTLESQFIHKFTTLPGTTLAQKYKNFYHILNETQNSLKLTNAKIDLSALHPRSPLEEVFKIKALIHFKCTRELYEVLKSENPRHVALALKHSPLFFERFNEVSPEELITKIFPSITYRTKEKLLNKLASSLNDESKSEAFFEKVRETYGLYLASKLLASCSGEFVMKCIDLYKIEVTADQLLVILKKRPELTEEVLEKLDRLDVNPGVGEKYVAVLKYLSKMDPRLYLKLQHKYSPRIYFGRRQTHAFINACKCIEQFDKIEVWRTLKDKQIVKSLGGEFPEFYYKIFPKRFAQLEYDHHELLDFLKGLQGGDPAKFGMFTSTFKRIYGADIWEYSTFKTPKFIKMMSPDEREVFLSNHARPSDIFEEVWIGYGKVEKSVPLLKEKIVLSSSLKGRIRCIKSLLETCRLNVNRPAMLDVLKYLNAKHRNDNVTVIEESLLALNTYDPKIFDANHWAEIYQYIQLYTLNYQSYSYYCRELVEKYVIHRLSHKKPVGDILEKWLKDFKNDFNVCSKHPKFKKICLQEFERLIPVDNYETLLLYWSSVNDFNRQYPKLQIEIKIKDEVIDYIKALQKDDGNSWAAREIVCYLIKQDCIKAEESGLVKFYLDAEYYDKMEASLIIWVIKNHPTVLLKYFNFIIPLNTYDHEMYKFLQKFCAMYTHLGIPMIISELCLNVIKSGENDKDKFKGAVIPLSILWATDKFLQFFLQNPDVTDRQRFTLIKTFKHLTPRSKSLPLILEFCKGSYLKHSQTQLGFASLDTIEDKLPGFYNQLIEQPVSVRKHVLSKSSKFLSLTQVNVTLAQFNLDKNASILRSTFQTALRVFLQNPNNSSWALCTDLASRVDFSVNAIDSLTKYKIPPSYFEQFIKLTLDIDERTGSKDPAWKTKLLNMVTINNVTNLSDEFCWEIIKQHLFKCDELSELQKAIQSFTCKYLIYGKEVNGLKCVFDILTGFLTTTPTNNIKALALKYKFINNFTKRLCNDCMDKQNAPIFNQFLRMWEDKFVPHESFDEFVYLQLTSTYLLAQQNQFDIVKISGKIKDLCDLLNQQNCLDVNCFSNIVKEFLPRFYALDFIVDSDENEMVLIESIVKDRSSYACLELALCLMVGNNSLSPVNRRKYNAIINEISAEPNRLLQVAFQSFFKE